MSTKQNINEFNEYMNSYRHDKLIQELNSYLKKSHAYKMEHK
jgi:hypothetical protein